jgi:hypothetical protein
MRTNDDVSRGLSAAQIHAFIHEGYVKVDGAFSKDLARTAREILWRDTGCDPNDPATWTRPVVRLGMYTGSPFVEAANTPLLHRCFDQLAGAGSWARCGAMGTFPVRFPSPDDPGDTGWHVDASFGHSDPDFMNWRVNVNSRGRLLLMLFLFSDVGGHDAPTRIRIGSHCHIARALAPAGEIGMTLGELVASDFGATSKCPEASATGEAGTVYLCHPFLVHAAQAHRGTAPRFLAQPPLLPRESDGLTGTVGKEDTPVQQAIRRALV